MLQAHDGTLSQRLKRGGANASVDLARMMKDAPPEFQDRLSEVEIVLRLLTLHCVMSGEVNRESLPEIEGLVLEAVEAYSSEQRDWNDLTVS